MIENPLLAFDADDTLWVTEPYYQEALQELKSILQPYLNGREIHSLVYEREIANLSLFGYGAKGFTLSMIETACHVSENRVSPSDIQKVIGIGKHIVSRPIEVFEKVPETLKELSQTYELTLITKGDLLDQRRKIERSKLGDLFTHIEIVSEKDESVYRSILAKHQVDPSRLIMVGDSMRSDILPVIALGGTAIHVPRPTNWMHEDVKTDAIEDNRIHRLARFADLPAFLESLKF